MTLDKTIEITQAYYIKTDEIAALIDRIENDVQYSQTWKEEKRKQLLNELESTRLAAIAQVEPIFNERIQQATTAQEMRTVSAEHQAAVSNALQMLTLLGDNATVQQLNNLLAPFVAASDFHTLDIFRSIIYKNRSVFDLPGLNFGTNQATEVQRHEAMRQIVLDGLRRNDGNKENFKLGFIMAMRIYGPMHGYADASDFKNDNPAAVQVKHA